MKVFGSSGTRGVAGEQLTAEFVLRVAKAAGTVWDTDRAAIARDTRTTGEQFANAADAGLTAVGVDADRLGVLPTPAAVRYAEVEELPAVVVTASHNPPEYNGIKLVGADGVELPVAELERVEDCLLGETFDEAGWQGAGSSTRIEGPRDDYVEDLLGGADREAIADADLTVALDPGHGAGALTSPEFFRRLGCEVVTVNGNPDGHFPGRDPEPVPENLDDLGRLVRATDADVGIAHDGDADRAIFFDETGEYIEGDASLAALAAEALEPGDATVAAVNVSQRLVDVCDDVGADLELTPIGATNIITRIQELQAADRRVPISGEGNGGIFFPNYRLVRDGAFIGAKFLELLAGTDAPASAVVEPYTAYENVRRNLSYGEESELSAMLAAAERYAEEADVEASTVDGYRLDYGDAWVLVRPSGTEPKVRIYAEAGNAGRATELADAVEDELRAALADA
ncbi:phosphoglucosamine mutase [Halolamina litorea]|uniref:Phosphoglucosamine mutase n=1 Tax=Halolamina litorea TaxID=1515593 RepID=A0ABD6BX51_9EURY|nr:phosphoglucosamine mutase [Halolamina litorea]